MKILIKIFNTIKFIFCPWLRYFKMETIAKNKLSMYWIDYQHSPTPEELLYLKKLVNELEQIGINGKTKPIMKLINEEFNNKYPIKD